MKRHAFTLIELLVVIAIIAMLVSILMPALSKARDMAKLAGCVSNQRTIGLAHMIYLEEHNQIGTIRNSNWLPTGQMPGGDSGLQGWVLGTFTDSPGNTYAVNQVRWYDVLAKPLGIADLPSDRMSTGDRALFDPSLYATFNQNGGVLWCPMDRSRTEWLRHVVDRVGTEWIMATRETSYGVPGTVTAAYGMQLLLNPGDRIDTRPGGLETRYTGHNFAKVSRPSEIVFLGEDGYTMWVHGTAALSEAHMQLEVPGSSLSYDHGRKQSWLFFDGHVAVLGYAPHELDTNGRVGVWRNGVAYASAGRAGFFKRFHGIQTDGERLP